MKACAEVVRIIDAMARRPSRRSLPSTLLRRGRDRQRYATGHAYEPTKCGICGMGAAHGVVAKGEEVLAPAAVVSIDTTRGDLQEVGSSVRENQSLHDPNG